MAKQPFISHAVNGYSRYDVPESKAFTCTAGILYPVRIDFINARDRISIEQGIDFRSNPLAVPTFNPYTVRLHRFWVPLQLYHAEMRTNSSKFDMNDLSLNWLPISTTFESIIGRTVSAAPNSLYSWLRIANSRISGYPDNHGYIYGISLSPSRPESLWVNADTYLAYWDIVRNYYSYSQWSVYSFAWPASWRLQYDASGSSAQVLAFHYSSDAQYFHQTYGNLEFLDAYFESQFYPNSVTSPNLTFSRANLFKQIVRSDLHNYMDGSEGKLGAGGDGYPVVSVSNSSITIAEGPAGQFSTSKPTTPVSVDFDLVPIAFHPMAVIPSSPDRFSRLLPIFNSGQDVSISNISTVPQLAVASRLQEYKDLLGAGGSRYSDWLETFFASKIEHVDRPKLLFSASQVVNSQIVLNQAGRPNLQGSQLLGAMGGTIAFNSKLGRRQSYYFCEPGYLIDMFSIRPVYYWAGIRPDYLNYRGSDYFNSIYNDIGYQSVPRVRFGTYFGTTDLQVAKEPCFNEFRASYDEALGSLSSASPYVAPEGFSAVPYYSYWLQQRVGSDYSISSFLTSNSPHIVESLFVDLNSVNSPFASNVEDNFFVNLSYSVKKKNLVNKTFATRLSNR